MSTQRDIYKIVRQNAMTNPVAGERVKISRKDNRETPWVGQTSSWHRSLCAEGTGTLVGVIPGNSDLAWFVNIDSGRCGAYWLDELERIS